MGEFSGKKKKKKVVVEDPVEENPDAEDTPVAEGQVAWAGSDRDYTYEEVSILNSHSYIQSTSPLHLLYIH